MLTKQELDFLAKFRKEVELSRYNIQRLSELSESLEERDDLSDECLRRIDSFLDGFFGFEDFFTVPESKEETKVYIAKEYIIQRP